MLKFAKSIKHKQIRPLPFAVYYYTVLFLVLSGLMISAYLAYSHYRVYTDIAYTSFCALSKAINCDTVSQSIYSIFLGIPVPIWGIIGYTFFLFLMPLARSISAKHIRMWSFLWLISLTFAVCSIVLAVISTFYIRSYCIMCILTYAVNLLLLFYTHLIRSRFKCEGLMDGFKLDLKHLANHKRYCLIMISSFLIGVVLTKVALPSYWQLETPIMPGDISTGFTETGHPWIGAKNPKITITEYTDYQCFQCKKMHFYLRQLIAQYPEKIRLIHRHFPIDHEFNPIIKEPFHIGSGKMALMAIFAGSEGRFWQMNDMLFKRAGESKTINIRNLAKEVGIDHNALVNAINDQTIRQKLANDIISGLRFRINGTPAFVINGQVYLAQIPPDAIKIALAE